MASEVTIHCKEGHASITLEPTDIGKLLEDGGTSIVPAGEICMTKTRLTDIIERSKQLGSGANLCNTPKVIKHEVVKIDDVNILKVEMTPYESLLAYPYGGTVIVVKSKDPLLPLPEGYRNVNILYGDKHVSNIEIELHPDMINIDLQFRVGYLTGKYMVGTNWVDAKVNEPTVVGPVIEPLNPGDIVYQEKPPYGFSFVAKTIDSNLRHDRFHVSTTWRIYGKNQDKFEQLWIKPKTDTDKDEIRIANLVPEYLSYGKTYYLTSVHHYHNGEYSVESTPLEFTLDGIIVSPPPCVDVYPGKVTISNPTFACSNDIDIKINNKDLKLDITSIETYYWDLKGPNGTKKYSTFTNQVNLPYGDLQPDTTYDLIVTYKHKAVGLSPESKITFRTEPRFIGDPSQLNNPIRIHNKTAFFGEVLQKDLMPNNVNYRGLYDEEFEYNLGDEVNKDGELYICKRKKQGGIDSFKSCFEKSSSPSADPYYKSEMPTYRWILNELGFNPYLTLPKIPQDEGLGNYLHPDTGTWLKCQNRMGRVIYISKFNVYNSISHNDLIKIGIYHPKRRTVRIRNRLFYARLLTTTMETYYDSIDPLKKDKINSIYGSEVVNVGEDDLITYLLNGKLNNYVSTDLDTSTIYYKEIVYAHNKCLISKINTAGSVTFNTVESSKPNLREYTVRLVLEEIPNAELPVYNISDTLPGGKGKVDENGKLYEYDPYADVCYLDFVTVDNFLTSDAINEKTGLFMDVCTPNTGWHKIYSKGLVYYVSQGRNYINPDLKRIEEMNMLSPSPIFKENTGLVKPNEVKYSKVVLNGLIFNVTVPEIVNYDAFHEVIPIDLRDYNILTGKKNKDLKLGDKSFWSNAVYRIIRDREDSPNPDLPGYKGVYPNYPKDNQTIDYIVDGEPNGWFLTSKMLFKEDGSLTYLLNSEKDTYVMKAYNEGDDVNVLLTLTISPTVGNKKIWDIK